MHVIDVSSDLRARYNADPSYGVAVGGDDSDDDDSDDEDEDEEDDGGDDPDMKDEVD